MRITPPVTENAKSFHQKVMRKTWAWRKGRAGRDSTALHHKGSPMMAHGHRGPSPRHLGSPVHSGWLSSFFILICAQKEVSTWAVGSLVIASDSCQCLQKLRTLPNSSVLFSSHGPKTKPTLAIRLPGLCSSLPASVRTTGVHRLRCTTSRLLVLGMKGAPLHVGSICRDCHSHREELK